MVKRKIEDEEKEKLKGRKEKKNAYNGKTVMIFFFRENQRNLIGI